MQRRRIQHYAPLDQRLAEQAKRLRAEARVTLPGIEREKLLRRARQIEAAAHVQDWLRSPRLQPPK